MSAIPSADRSSRLFGLDLLRLVSFFAIVEHHLQAVIFYQTDVTSYFHTNPLLRAIEIEARLLSFSGQTILFLSSFLIGRAEKTPRKTLEVIAFVSLGWVAFCLYNYQEGSLIFWGWDIYPLIMAGLASGMLMKRIGSRWVYGLGILGFVMTLTEPWKWDVFRNFSFYWKHILVGECEADAAYWPVLPWIGLIWAGYAWGTHERSRLDRGVGSTLAKWWKWETLLWPVLMLASIPVLGRFFDVPLGPGFACFVFRQEPVVFWGNFLFVVFAMRVSLLESVQSKLARYRVFHWLADLRISRRFGLAYLTHYSLLEFLDWTAKDAIRESDLLLLFASLAILPVTELLLRLFEVGARLFSRSSPKASV